MTGTILLLAFLTYLVYVDRNVADYLYLKLIKTPILLVKIRAYQIRLYIAIRYEMLQMRRGVIPKKYFKMVSEITKE
jgi:hypothetical protein